MKRLDAPSEFEVRKSGGYAERSDHELLEINVIIGMPTTVNNVHTGNGEKIRIDSAKVSEKRKLQMISCRMCSGQRYVLFTGIIVRKA